MNKLTAFLTSLFFYLIISSQCSAQSVTWHWSLTKGDALNEYIEAIDCDDDGNFYVTGNFQGTIDFFGETLTAIGYYDVFIARFDANGNMIWVKQGSGEYEVAGHDIYVDDEFVYVTGGFVDQAVFEDETLVSEGARDMFLLKYDLNGALIWAVRGGSVTDDAGHSVAADESGNIYITGDINYTATFGDHTVPYYGFTDLFIAKYDEDGICNWAKSAGGPIYDYGACIETIDDHLFVSGAFNDVAQFDTASITSVDFVDIFIAHYLTDGSFVEVMSAGGTNNENISCMVVDDDLNVYIGGWYMLDITIGENSFTSNGGMDIYLAKFEPGIGFAWASSYGGPGIDEVLAMSNGWVSGGKNKTDSPVIVAGTFENTVIFGNIDLTSEGFDDGFILQLNGDGSIVWSEQIGGSGSLRVSDCVLDQESRCYFVGDFLDELKIGNKIYNPAGGYDLFIAKLGESLGINEPKFEINQIDIFPNPVISETTLIYFLNVDSEVKVEIYCQDGKLINHFFSEKQLKGSHTIEIDVSELSQGIHYLILKTGTDIQSGKLVKIEH